eukprot:364577-Chlamydomonas_euryale.AAC.26
MFASLGGCRGPDIHERLKKPPAGQLCLLSNLETDQPRGFNSLTKLKADQPRGFDSLTKIEADQPRGFNSLTKGECMMNRVQHELPIIARRNNQDPAAAAATTTASLSQT